MTTNLDEPVILATLVGASGEPAGPLLIDGYALLVTVHNQFSSVCTRRRSRSLIAAL